MTNAAVGFGRRDITPPIGSPSSLGLFVPIEEIWDPLSATAVVLESGTARIAIVGLDLCGLLETTHRRIRQAVEQVTGIPSDLVVLSASHTHSAPYLSDDVQDMLRPHGLRLMDDAYVTAVIDAVAAAVSEALGRVEPARASVGRGPVDRVAANRRPIGPDGQTVHRYGRPEEPWLRDLPEGLIDPEVAVVRFDRPDGVPIGAITVYACHPTAAGGGINTYISADFVGTGRALLEAELGYPIAFLQGCGGDQGTGKWIRGTAREDTTAMGERFADGVRAGLEALRPAAGDWTFDATTVELGFEPFPAASSLEAAFVEAIASGDSGEIMSVGDRLAVVWRQDTLRKARVTTVVLGDVALTILPGEVFLGHGLAIRAGSPFADTIVAAYNDNTPQYIPTSEAFDHGAYEVDGGWRYIERGAGERLATDAIGILRRLADASSADHI